VNVGRSRAATSLKKNEPPQTVASASSMPHSRAVIGRYALGVFGGRESVMLLVADVAGTGLAGDAFLADWATHRVPHSPLAAGGFGVFSPRRRPSDVQYTIVFR
jgi:hypothetical protein